MYITTESCVVLFDDVISIYIFTTITSYIPSMAALRSALHAFNANVGSFNPQDDDPLICPACHKRMKTVQGVTAHLQMARGCLWYKKGKLRELTLPGQSGEEVIRRRIDERPELPRQEPELDPMEVMEEFGQQMYDFIPPSDDDNNGEGSSDNPHWQQQTWSGEGEEDMRIIDEHPSAGRVIRLDETLHQLWRRRFGEEGSDGVDVNMMDDTGQPSSSYNAFAPFASELDWRVAHWAVSEGIGHKSFNRLMEIPGVCLSEATMLNLCIYSDGRVYFRWQRS
jgi:hypothetical protein